MSRGLTITLKYEEVATTVRLLAERRKTCDIQISYGEHYGVPEMVSLAKIEAKRIDGILAHISKLINRQQQKDGN